MWENHKFSTTCDIGSLIRPIKTENHVTKYLLLSLFVDKICKVYNINFSILLLIKRGHIYIYIYIFILTFQSYYL